MKVQCRHCGSGTWVVNDAGDTRCTGCGRDWTPPVQEQPASGRAWKTCEPCSHCADTRAVEGMDGDLLCRGCYSVRVFLDRGVRSDVVEVQR
jgi:hypothetical protein